MYGDCLPYGSSLTWILEEPQFLLFLHLLTYFALASCLSFGGCPCCLFADSSSQFPVIRPPVKHDKWDRCLWPWKDLQKRAAGVSLQSAPCYCSVYVFINSDDQCEQKTVETTGVCHWKREDYQVFVQISPCYLFFSQTVPAGSTFDFYSLYLWIQFCGGANWLQCCEKVFVPFVISKIFGHCCFFSFSHIRFR